MRFVDKETTLLLSVFLMLCFFAPVYGYEEESATANQAHELTECSAFYAIYAEGVKRAGNEKRTNNLLAASYRAFDSAVKLSNLKIAKETMGMSLDEQRKEMNNNYSNFSILSLKYKDICKEALESPDKRLQYWLNKKD
jgi:hypothetical protein